MSPRLAASELDLAGGPVDEGAELIDLDPADGVDEAFDQPAVQVAHKLGVRLGELGERAAGERDGGDAVVVGHRRVEAHAGEIVDKRSDADRSSVIRIVELGHDGCGLHRRCRDPALLAADLDGLVAAGAGGGGHTGEHLAMSGMAGGSKPREGASGDNE